MHDSVMSRLKSERLAAGLNQTRLAGLAGVDQSTISRLETNDTSDPGLDVLQNIAWALNKCGRDVTANELHPSRAPMLVRSGGGSSKRRRMA